MVPGLTGTKAARRLQLDIAREYLIDARVGRTIVEPLAKLLKRRKLTAGKYLDIAVRQVDRMAR